MARRTAEEAAATREALLDAALSVFADRGYIAAALEDIAAKASVTRGALYHHFDNKAEIYGALVAERWASVMAPLWAHLEGDAPPRARLRAFLVAYFKAIEGDRRVRALLEMTMLGGERATDLADGLGQKRAALEAWAGALEPLVRGGGASARGRSKEGARLRAAAVVAYVNGVTVTWLLCPTLLSPAKDAERLADACLDGVVEGGPEQGGSRGAPEQGGSRQTAKGRAPRATTRG